MRELFLLSESRGKEAAGLAMGTPEQLLVYRRPVPAHDLVRVPEFKKMIGTATKANGHATEGLMFIGHSRLETDGMRQMNRNNQPVVAGGMVGVHNGIVVNHKALRQKHQAWTFRSELDSEVIFALLRIHLDAGASLPEATRKTFGEIQGATSIAALFEDHDTLLLATNNGSLYYRIAPEHSEIVFASESYILEQMAERASADWAKAETRHLRPGEAVAIDTRSLDVSPFSLKGEGAPSSHRRTARRTLVDLSPPDPPAKPVQRQRVSPGELAERFPYRSMKDRLRRCTQCILPETMPYIDFDQDGVCWYCRHHGVVTALGKPALEAIVAPHRRSDGRPDCVVGVSGGRDSIYGLHYIKTVLGMNPIAYTYDWGMVTDLARRNTSRICGKLGIEHILVSADIPQKREFVRKNVAAWLAKPTLGTIPLFMAGDKAYFHHLQQVKKQTGAKLGILCENLLERTDFKTGFAGVPPAFDDAHVYTLPVTAKLRMMAYYGKAFLDNPRFLNASLVDSARAFGYYYFIERDYTNLYRYVTWDEDEVNSTLLGTYDFELAPDTNSTWRIGDGTAAFYNYIYYAVNGMSENDTFRSNQIRAGQLDRQTALERVDVENRPRFHSIQWYLDTIGLEMPIDQVLATIEAIPKRYPPA